MSETKKQSIHLSPISMTQNALYCLKTRKIKDFKSLIFVWSGLKWNGF